MIDSDLALWSRVVWCGADYDCTYHVSDNYQNSTFYSQWLASGLSFLTTICIALPVFQLLTGLGIGLKAIPQPMIKTDSIYTFSRDIPCSILRKKRFARNNKSVESFNLLHSLKLDSTTIWQSSLYHDCVLCFCASDNIPKPSTLPLLNNIHIFLRDSRIFPWHLWWSQQILKIFMIQAFVNIEHLLCWVVLG